MRLKTDEAFKGVALFEPDPELKDNPGYFEYYDHYDNQANQYVPCAGDKCPFCAANDNPSTRAMTVWYFPNAADVKDKIKVFTMNYSTTQDISDEAEDEGGILGKVIRVKRLSDKGDYRVKVTTDKSLTKAQMKEAMGLLEEKFPDGLIALVEKQLGAQMERLKALDAMDDDDDEDEEDETPPKARRGKANSKAKDDDEEEEEEEEEEDETASEGIEDTEFELLKVSKRNNSVTVEHEDEEIELVGDEDTDVSSFKKGDIAVISAEYDDDEEAWVLTSIEAPTEAEEEEEEEEEEEDEEKEEDEDEEITSIEGIEYEVTKVEEEDEIIHLQNDEEKIKMWVGDGVNPDYDEVKKGATVLVNASVDDEGDWIITEISVKKARRRTAARK
jgi:hypothetical protein